MFSQQVIINDQLPYTRATLVANQTVIGTGWTANAASDVVVYYTPFGDSPDDATQQLTSNQFSVAFIGGSQQVQVTLVTPANQGDIATVIRNTPADRLNLYTNTNFTPTMLNQDFGILTLVDQQAQLVDQLVGPRYNYSALITPVVDTILPILLANQIWVKNSGNTAIIGLDVPSSGFAPANGTYVLLTPNAALPSAQALSSFGASGILAFNNGTQQIVETSILGTSNQITVTNGLGVGTIGLAIASNPIMPGTAGMGIPEGTTAQRVIPGSNISLRFNTDLGALEYYNSGWIQLIDDVIVQPGLINELAWYAATGQTVSGLPTVAAGVLTTVSNVPTWASELSLALGGTNANLTASNGGIFYSTASAGAILAGTATANQVLLSGSSAAPAWSTAIYPATTTINQLLYSSSANTITGLATATTAVLTTSSGVPTWAAELSMALGGTNANLTAAAGAVPYSTASALALSAVGTSGQLFQSAGAGAPGWTTSTYPATNAINTLLYASAANTMAALATANDGVLITSNTGVPSWLANGTTGQILTATTGSPPSWAAPAASSITFTGDSGTPFSGAAVTVTGGATGLTFAAASPNLTLAGTLVVGNGGTGKTSVTTAPAATSWAGWDANKNLSANSLIEGYTTTATAAAITTLLVGSTYLQYFTGSTTQTVQMPVTSTLVLGQQWRIVNLSTGVVTITSSGGNTIQAMAAGSNAVVTCIATSGTTAASWDCDYSISAGAAGTVNSGLINQLAWYASSGTAVSGLATAASGVLVTSAGSVPSISSTLPSGLTIPGFAHSGVNSDITSMTGLTGTLQAPTGVISSAGAQLLLFTYTASAVNYFSFINNIAGSPPSISAVGGDTNIILQLGGKGTGGAAVKGTSTNDNATAGFVGEFVSSVIPFSSSVSLTNLAAADVTSISLTAGDWDVWGNIHTEFPSNGTAIYGWTSATSATLPDSSLYNAVVPVGGIGSSGQSVPYKRYSLASTTTIYLSTFGQFSTGTASACGGIYARRVR
jgi:hypothetical protein